MFDFIKQANRAEGGVDAVKVHLSSREFKWIDNKVNVHKEHLFWWFHWIHAHRMWVCEWQMTAIYVNKSIDWHTH